MKDYRIFRLDNSGRITSAVEFYCETDQEAIGVAERHENKAGLELWHRGQRIQLFPAPQAVARAG
ncbi:hypothetical protein QO010_001929 [Caulobacter ginsengisoli]|uniref:Uncharacterized protein n=1 Tax=Caulobacter ginsengisoli TaxID=400775 RepID=A0ABU0ISM8_9CAUL|nr:hypothetical protein [Caulobacter ginsengisoli]MDQ0464158.1 hypothetical protein [Caulobacter ginsengisoli]